MRVISWPLSSYFTFPVLSPTSLQNSSLWSPISARMEASLLTNSRFGCRISFSGGGVSVKSKAFVGSISYRRCRPSRFSIAMCLERSDYAASETNSRHTASNPNEHTEQSVVQSTGEQFDRDMGLEKSEKTSGAIQQKRAAKIHDFCFGIPFGGFVLTSGIVGFLFSRNPTSLSTGVPFGGASLFLSIYSLKIWREGKSNLPLIIGQAALAAGLLWKHLQIYNLTKKLFPTGIYALVSAAMLCFFTYVIASGGNPPPKKLKLAATQSS